MIGNVAVSQGAPFNFTSGEHTITITVTDSGDETDFNVYTFVVTATLT